MSDALFWHRLQFAFTIVYHYLFPQLTMGLALLIVIMKALGLWGRDERWNDAARFWIRIFGINFAVGVVTGIPMEFQFGTNWANFSRLAGPVIGHTLGMEGLFAFFLESSFLASLVWGEKRLGRTGHFLAAIALFLGSWLSGYFIIATNAFMQHPVGHRALPDGSLRLADFRAFVLNPWALAQYAHNMAASVVTASFVVAAAGAHYALSGRHLDHARRFLALGTRAGVIASLLVAFPTGDHQAKLIARFQPVALAAMEGRFESGPAAPITMIGQPNVKERRLDNPVPVPGMLSFLAYGTFQSNVRGLLEFPERDWPDNIELLYYAFHVMAGLGTLLFGVMAVAVALDLRRRLERSRAALWVLMLSFPFPYIATTAGWMTAELGRQPWLVYGLLRTALGASPTVHSGTVLFTLIGFCGLYFVLGVLFLFLIGHEIQRGPEAGAAEIPHG
ncbi:MAG: cytochrome ubiquinol oxidase subunit I [Candidatus Eisenbacteria bacterium]|uniref:Cytochrome ubiquinol oxidase subunit I n=1 Tax=Eiseniibacteriota bacterium TaxID=2212470 RepID=A0A538SGP2_UNCEI|nr:MAG: cytochrome ubiquinol oxidase subunit I [Candidatus Eisenbacteria bacterium]